MERPGHALEAINASSKSSKTIGLTFVIVIHIAIITALIIGLRQAALHHELAALNASVERQKAVPKAPPPPPPDLIRPPPTATIVPDFNVVVPPPKAAPPPPAAPPAPPAKVAPTLLEPIRRTFTLPPYPPVSLRLGEQGTTTLKISINTDGVVTEATVEKSSGSDRLDQAAAEYVKAHYRYKPPTQDGKPVAAVTLLNVVWNVKDAQ